MSDQIRKLTHSPSFGDAERLQSTTAAAADLPSSGDYDSDGEFEFSVGPPAANSGDPADDIFSNGRILPVYPVFNRDLLSSKPDPDPDPVTLRSGSTSSTSSAESVEIDAPAGTYCAWAPRSAPQSPDRAACKKSSSTGSGSGSGSATSRRWRVRDLVGGRRSHSDGKEKFALLSSNGNAGSDPKPKADPNRKPAKEMDLITAHRLFYGKDRAAAEKGNGRRSFLPYRPELVGLFSNSRAHHHHPFNF